MGDKDVYSAQICGDISVASWPDQDFEICIEEVANFGDVDRYLNLEQAKALHDALGKHINRFADHDKHPKDEKGRAGG